MRQLAADSRMVWQSMSLQDAKASFEREFIHNKLLSYGWNVSETAAALGIERSNLYKKIREHDLKQN